MKLKKYLPEIIDGLYGEIAIMVENDKYGENVKYKDALEFSKKFVKYYTTNCIDYDFEEQMDIDKALKQFMRDK